MLASPAVLQSLLPAPLGPGPTLDGSERLDHRERERENERKIERIDRETTEAGGYLSTAISLLFNLSGRLERAALLFPLMYSGASRLVIYWLCRLSSPRLAHGPPPDTVSRHAAPATSTSSLFAPHALSFSITFWASLTLSILV